jgi:aminopeptidase
MADARVVQLARILVDHSTRVKPGERVVIFGRMPAVPLMLETYRVCLERGAHPYTFVRDPYGRAGLSDQEFIYYKHASEAQLEEVDPFIQLAIESADAWIRIDSDENTRHLSSIDPGLISRRRLANAPISAIFRRRSKEKSLRWVYTLFPTAGLAQDAEMSLTEFEDFVYRTAFADQTDPVQAWDEMYARQQALVDYLAGKSRVRVEGENIDLSFSVVDRKFINCAGEYNIPDGEIFTGPVEESVEGWVRFTYPAVYGGREVNDVELNFKAGRVEKASATKNEAYLLSQIDLDPGARFLGEFAIGTNSMVDRFTRNVLFDEKIGGTIHMALGAGYAESGSKNDSLLYWDMICDMRTGGRIYVDDELFYDSGDFVFSP